MGKTTIKELEKRVTALERKISILAGDPKNHDCKLNAYKIAENCYRCGVCGKLVWT